MANILKSLKENISQQQISKYISHVEKFTEDINSDSATPEESFVTSVDVAAALLKMYTNLSGNQTSTCEIDDASTAEFNTDSDMVRFFINIGSESKIQPKHIIESLCESTGLPGKMVGSIDIFDKYSFVEVPKEFAPEVLKAMKNNTIKGKRINIERSNARKKSGHGHTPSRSGPGSNPSAKRKPSFSNNFKKPYKKD